LLAEVANRASGLGTMIGARHSFDYRGDADAEPESSATNGPIDLFRSPSPQGLNWLGLSAEVREKVTRLIARMLSRHEPGNLPASRDGGGDDE
jgi:hypothetical protein